MDDRWLNLGVPGRCVKTLQSEIYIRFAHMVRGNVSWMMWFAETYTWYTLTWNTWFQHAADLLWLISHRDYLPAYRARLLRSLLG